MTTKTPKEIRTPIEYANLYMKNKTSDENKNKWVVTCPNCKHHFTADVSLLRRWVLEEGEKKEREEFAQWLINYYKDEVGDSFCDCKGCNNLRRKIKELQGKGG